MKDPKDYNVRAIERAIQILDCFNNDNPSWGLTEIAQEVGLHKATTHRIMTTLTNHNYLVKSSDGLKYKLGPRLASLGCSVIQQFDIRNVALPYMKETVQKFNETCDLSIFDGREILYLEVLQSNHALTISAAPGKRLPAHCTASGKVFLAYLSEENFNKFISQPLKSFTNQTITNPQILKKSLKEIKESGFATDNEEMELGIRAIAVPIFNQNGEVIASVSIPGPINRILDEKIPDFLFALQQISKNISHSLGVLR
jgi:DNA-binding IclR family transcriptional regulator